MLLLKLTSKLLKLVKKTPICSKDMEKMQPEFPASRIFPRGGMHNIEKSLEVKTFKYLFNGFCCKSISPTDVKDWRQIVSSR